MVKRFGTTFIFLAVLGAVWEACVRSGVIDEFLFPAPSQIGLFIWHSALDGSLLNAAFVTFMRLLAGYIIGVLLGLPLGMLCARFRALDDTLGVLALGFQTLPSVCWVPIAVLWFGQSEGALLFVVIMGCLWSVLLATQQGVL